MIEHSGWFNQKDHQFISLIDYQLISTLTIRQPSLSPDLQPSVDSNSFNAAYIDLRLLRHFQVLFIPEIGGSAANEILSTKIKRLREFQAVQCPVYSHVDDQAKNDEIENESDNEDEGCNGANEELQVNDNSNPSDQCHNDNIKNYEDETFSIAEILFKIHQSIVDEFRPSTSNAYKGRSRFHLHFNFRHVLRVLQVRSIYDCLKYLN